MLLVLALGAPAYAAEQESDSGTINIMRSEPGTPVTHKKSKENSQKPPRKLPHKRARGSSNPVYPAPLPGPQAPLPVPHQEAVAPHRPEMPPPLYVPQTGRTLLNLPTVSGAGPNGAETFQDRAARCAHQAGVYGAAVGDPNAYIGSCINQ
jgi:hypothetical protein